METVGCAVDFASGGKVRLPSSDIRDIMGVKSGSTTLANQESVLTSGRVNRALKKLGLEPTKPVVMLGRDFSDEVVKRALDRRDVWFSFQVAYKVVNARQPKVSGDPAFDGFHAVGSPLRTTTLARGVRYVKVWDPLNDGRRAGIPTGPVMWPLWLVLAACEDMRVRLGPNKYSTVKEHFGAGKFCGMLVRRAKVAKGPEEEPDPVDPCESVWTEREQALRAEFAEQTRELLLGIQAGLTSAQTEYDEAVEAIIAQALEENAE